MTTRYRSVSANWLALENTSAGPVMSWLGEYSCRSWHRRVQLAHRLASSAWAGSQTLSRQIVSRLVTKRDPESPFGDRAWNWLASRSIYVGGAAAGVAPVVNGFLPASHGFLRCVLTGCLVLVALGGFSIPAARARIAETRARSAEAEAAEAAVTMRFGLSDVMLPLLSYAISGIDPRSSESPQTVLAGVTRMVLAAAAELCGRDDARVRACWYRYKPDAVGVVAPGRFVPEGHHGRGQRPSTMFLATEDRGYELLRMILNDSYELWSDLTTSRPQSWKPTGNGTTYKSFLAVPVRTDKQAFGFLTVDADLVGNLDESDVPIAQVLGWMLALILSHQPDAQSIQAAIASSAKN